MAISILFIIAWVLLMVKLVKQEKTDAAHGVMVVGSLALVFIGAACSDTDKYIYALCKDTYSFWEYVFVRAYHSMWLDFTCWQEWTLPSLLAAGRLSNVYYSFDDDDGVLADHEFNRIIHAEYRSLEREYKHHQEASTRCLDAKFMGEGAEEMRTHARDHAVAHDRARKDIAATIAAMPHLTRWSNSVEQRLAAQIDNVLREEEYWSHQRNWGTELEELDF